MTRQTISKPLIKHHMYKPVGDYFMQKLDRFSYRLTLYNRRDAIASIPSLSARFSVVEETDLTYIISTLKTN